MFYRMPERIKAGGTLLACLAAILAASCQNYGDMPPYDGWDAAEADVEAEIPDEPADESPEDPIEEPAEDPVVEPHPDCVAEQTPVVSPGHAPGTLCVGCHVMYLPLITVGGTLYTDDTGSAPVMGATIIVTDSTGSSVEMVSTMNGNFYANHPLTPPLTVAASKCPDHQVMMSGATSGECNSCHGLGARIHLP